MRGGASLPGGLACSSELSALVARGGSPVHPTSAATAIQHVHFAMPAGADP